MIVWSRDRADTLIVLWNAGASAREIAECFQDGGWRDCSRNAVLGQINRLRDAGVDLRRVSATERGQRIKAASHRSYRVKEIGPELGRRAE